MHRFTTRGKLYGSEDTRPKSKRQLCMMRLRSFYTAGVCVCVFVCVRVGRIQEHSACFHWRLCIVSNWRRFVFGMCVCVLCVFVCVCTGMPNSTSPIASAHQRYKKVCVHTHTHTHTHRSTEHAHMLQCGCPRRHSFIWEPMRRAEESSAHPHTDRE